jgi:hypothetical protein
MKSIPIAIGTEITEQARRNRGDYFASKKALSFAADAIGA